MSVSKTEDRSENIFWAWQGRGNSIKRFTKFLLGRVTLDVYVTNNVSELIGVKNEVFTFHFFFTETHPWAGPQIASLWLVYTIQRQGTNRCRSATLARVLGSRWLEKLQAKWSNTCWFSDSIIITCVILISLTIFFRDSHNYNIAIERSTGYTKEVENNFFFFTFYITKLLYYSLHNPPRITLATCGLYMNLFF